MRSPVLIAETPFAAGHGPRYLAPPGREVDGATAAYYVGRLRDDDDDVEEIEGDDYLAVRRSLTDDGTGESAPSIPDAPNDGGRKRASVHDPRGGLTRPRGYAHLDSHFGGSCWHREPARSRAVVAVWQCFPGGR